MGGIYHTRGSMGLFGTSHVPVWTRHILYMQGIQQVYAWSIQVRDWYWTKPSILLYGIYRPYHRVTQILVFTWYIPGIYLWHQHIPGMCQVYIGYRPVSTIYPSHMSGIYIPYTIYIFISTFSPGGWCCGGVQGPIPAAPPATTLPGLVMTRIVLLPALRHHAFLLLVMWLCRARLELNRIYVSFLTSTA